MRAHPQGRRRKKKKKGTRKVENKWTAALDCLLDLRRLIKVPSEGEHFYPPSHGNETPPRADGEEEKPIAGCKEKNERIYIEEGEKKKPAWSGFTLRMEFEWQPDRASKSTINTADNESPPGFQAQPFSRPTWFFLFPPFKCEFN